MQGSWRYYHAAFALGVACTTRPLLALGKRVMGPALCESPYREPRQHCDASSDDRPAQCAAPAVGRGGEAAGTGGREGVDGRRRDGVGVRAGAAAEPLDGVAEGGGHVGVAPDPGCLCDGFACRATPGDVGGDRAGVAEVSVTVEADITVEAISLPAARALAVPSEPERAAGEEFTVRVDAGPGVDDERLPGGDGARRERPVAEGVAEEPAAQVDRLVADIRDADRGVSAGEGDLLDDNAADLEGVAGLFDRVGARGVRRPRRLHPPGDGHGCGDASDEEQPRPARSCVKIVHKRASWKRPYVSAARTAGPVRRTRASQPYDGILAFRGRYAATRSAPSSR